MALDKKRNSTRKAFLDRAVELRFRERRDKFVAAALSGITVSSCERTMSEEEEVAWAIDIGTLAAEALTTIDEMADGISVVKRR